MKSLKSRVKQAEKYGLNEGQFHIVQMMVKKNRMSVDEAVQKVKQLKIYIDNLED